MMQHDCPHHHSLDSVDALGQIRRPLALLLLLFGCGFLAVGAAQEDNYYPHTEERGRAAIEYADDEIHVVAAYYYSQRHHDSRWLLIEAAISAERVMDIQRNDIRLVMPDGREVALASQRRFLQDLGRVRGLLQNASVTRHGVGGYFKGRRGSELRFFALPFEGTVRDSIVVDPWRIGWGDLFFVSPTGLWEPGTYSLVVQHEELQAVLPIRLE